MGLGSSAERVDVAIIGAGLSGLAAGIRSAYYDKRTVVFERHTTIGGLNSFYRLRGRDHDVGLHAVTNYAEPGTRKGPMAKLLKQLRLRWDDFDLRPQLGSRIAFPGADADLRFSNDAELLRSEVARRFPRHVDAFDSLRQKAVTFDSTRLDQEPLSAKAVVGEFLPESDAEAALLSDMLFNPLQFYGSAVPGDMDWSQFCIMWQAIFEEGFGRPFGGVRPIMKALVKKYREVGGELRLRTGVKRIVVDGERAVGLVLDDGTEVAADVILSSAGSFETQELTKGDIAPPPPRVALSRKTSTSAAFDVAAIPEPPDERLGFLETIYVLDRSPRELTPPHEETIVFYSTASYAEISPPQAGGGLERFRYRVAEDAVDPTSGVICSPNNFAYDDGVDLPEGVVRVTSLANPTYWLRRDDQWPDLAESGSPAEDVPHAQAGGSRREPATYADAKALWTNVLADTAASIIPDFRPHIVETDAFTPRTVAKYTGKTQGNIYGAQKKTLSGQTDFANLHLIGTDQGFLGIVGAMLSGISISNAVAVR